MTEGEAEDRPIFRAALALGSQELSIAEITDGMGRQPDWSRDIGGLLPTGMPRLWSRWSLELEFNGELHRGGDGLAEAIVKLGDDVADRAAALQARGCAVTISVEQHVDPEDASTTGIHLDEAAVAWLARAHASLDIDQYGEDPTFPRAARLWLDNRLWNLRRIRWFVQQRLRVHARC